MGDVLGIGLTHYPPLAGVDEHMANILKWSLADPDVPEELRTPAGWPAEMRDEWGDDQGTAAATEHRRRLLEGLRQCRKTLDEFKPDLVLVWGDDQYENFKEEVIPPFCVLAYDDVQVQPFLHQRGPNAWGEAQDTSFTLRGNRPAAKELVNSLLQQDFDVAYSYRPREGADFPHAFVNTLLYLDYDRTGFSYPIIPMSVNCYGKLVIARKGGMARFASIGAEADLDPIAPTPARCMALGAAVAKAVADGPHRVALVASSSWSHAFLHDVNWHLYPDVASDRAFYEALRSGDYDFWRSTSGEEICAKGQQEMLNWFCLLGAMEQLGKQATWTDLVETNVLNSNKCFATFQ